RGLACSQVVRRLAYLTPSGAGPVQSEESERPVIGRTWPVGQEPILGPTYAVLGRIVFRPIVSQSESGQGGGRGVAGLHGRASSVLEIPVPVGRLFRPQEAGRRG